MISEPICYKYTFGLQWDPALILRIGPSYFEKFAGLIVNLSMHFDFIIGSAANTFLLPDRSLFHQVYTCLSIIQSQIIVCSLARVPIHVWHRIVLRSFIRSTIESAVLLCCIVFSSTKKDIKNC